MLKVAHEFQGHHGRMGEVGRVGNWIRLSDVHMSLGNDGSPLMDIEFYYFFY